MKENKKIPQLQRDINTNVLILCILGVFFMFFDVIYIIPIFISFILLCLIDIISFYVSK